MLNLAVRVVAIGLFKGLKTPKNRVFLLGRLLTLEIVISFHPKGGALHVLSIRCF